MPRSNHNLIFRVVQKFMTTNNIFFIPFPLSGEKVQNPFKRRTKLLHHRGNQVKSGISRTLSYLRTPIPIV